MKRKTSQQIEQVKESTISPQIAGKAGNRDLTAWIEAGKAYRFRPGQASANPGGRPKNDIAAMLAREVIEDNYEQAKAGLSKSLAKGNAYTFEVLGNRGYGKLTEHTTVGFENVPDAGLDEQIRALEIALGIAGVIDATLPEPPQLPAAPEGDVPAEPDATPE